MSLIESGLRQKGHLSSEANLYFSDSFLVVIILCITLKENCLSLLSFEDIYIRETITPIRKCWKAFLPSPYFAGFRSKFLDEQIAIIFTAQFSEDYCSIFHLTVLWCGTNQIRKRGITLSSEEASLCHREADEKEKESALGTIGLNPLPIVPRELSIFRLRSFCRGERGNQMPSASNPEEWQQ